MAVHNDIRWTPTFFRVTRNLPQEIRNNPLSLFQSFFRILKVIECPLCGSEEITDEFHECVGYNDRERIIDSVFPLKITEQPEGMALCTMGWCEIQDEGDCNNCRHTNFELLENSRDFPEGSVFCEKCGFYFFPGEKVGIVDCWIE